MRSKPSTFNVILGCSRIAVQSPYSGQYVLHLILVMSSINSVQLAAFLTKCDLCYSCGANWRKICIRSISEGIEEQHPGYDAVFLGSRMH